MKKNMHVEVNAKSGRTYIYENVAKIDYNFNRGSMINIAIHTENGEREFKVFSKKDIESIGVTILTDDNGNNQICHEENGEDSYLPDYNIDDFNDEED